MKLPALTNPFYLAHRALRAEIALMAVGTRGVIVDVGCGAAPYRGLFEHARYIGIEVATVSACGSSKGGADVYFDGRHLPLPDASIDTVLCNQVLEHVFEPVPFLQEIERVLVPGGRLLLTVPFVWDEHEQPYDFARYSSFGLRHLAKSCGFEVIEARRTLADASLFAQLWLAYLFKVVRGGKPSTLPGKLFLAAASVPVNLLGLAASRMLPANPDLYLDNAMILKKLPGNLP